MTATKSKSKLKKEVSRKVTPTKKVKTSRPTRDVLPPKPQKKESFLEKVKKEAKSDIAKFKKVATLKEGVTIEVVPPNSEKLKEIATTTPIEETKTFFERLKYLFTGKF
jgi:hypothetical protein